MLRRRLLLMFAFLARTSPTSAVMDLNLSQDDDTEFVDLMSFEEEVTSSFDKDFAMDELLNFDSDDEGPSSSAEGGMESSQVTFVELSDKADDPELQDEEGDEDMDEEEEEAEGSEDEL